MLNYSDYGLMQQGKFLCEQIFISHVSNVLHLIPELCLNLRKTSENFKNLQGLERKTTKQEKANMHAVMQIWIAANFIV